MIIDSFDTDKKILIIAEIGNNHEGSLRLAERLIHEAALSGADAVKFQTIVPEKLVSCFQKERLSQLRRFQLSYKNFEKLHDVAKKKGVLFLSTPFDIESVLFLNKLLPAFKISSGDINFYPMIKVIAETAKPIFLSTGASTMIEIRRTVNFIKEIWQKKKIKQDLAVLHCVASYPTPLEEANLLSINFLRKKFNCVVGYSDHTVGIDAAIVAVALGARIIEKHFTINKNYSDFRDHKLSADPKELALLVGKVRQLETMLGKEEKLVRACESQIRDRIRRFIVAKKNMPKGSLVKSDDICYLRADKKGLSCDCKDWLIGKRLNNSVKKGEIITEKLFNS